MRVWILPQRPDVEAAMIRRLLTDAGEMTAESWDDPLVEDARARGGAIYAIEREDWPDWTGRDDPSLTDCAAIVSCIDHHRPGDPGYGRPPAEFLAASSIGQVIAQLARMDVLPEDWRYVGIHADDPTYWDRAGKLVPLPGGRTVRYWHALGMSYDYRIPADHVLAAAADHCPAAAYRGECPGVDPVEVARWRVETRAAQQGRTVEEVLADVERAQQLLEDAPNERLAHGVYVADMRGYGHVPELPEAALREGVAYIAMQVERDTGRRKVVLGAASPEQVRAFLDVWAPAQGLTSAYGDPARGFAGAYLPS